MYENVLIMLCDGICSKILVIKLIFKSKRIDKILFVFLFGRFFRFEGMGKEEVKILWSRY